MGILYKSIYSFRLEFHWVIDNEKLCYSARNLYIYLTKYYFVFGSLKIVCIQTLTIELTGKDALKALQNLEQKELIRIVKEPDPNLYSLSGEPLSDEDFINWIENAEKSPTLSLTETKQLWETQKKKCDLTS